MRQDPSHKNVSVHTEWKFCYYSLTRMSLPNPWKLCSSSEHKLDIFDAFRELSDPPIDSNVITTINVQKRSKEIGKIIHVTSGVQL